MWIISSFWIKITAAAAIFAIQNRTDTPPVPGSWQVDEVNSILEDVYQDKKIFGCESAAAEPFIKNLLFSDNRWTLAELVGDAVPAYAYIYHSRVNNFMGNQTCCEFRFHEDDIA